MRIALLSDIHGNLPALDAVLDDVTVQRVDRIANLGDILSGPLWVAETAARLMALDLPTIAGNHERQVLTMAPERMGASDAHAAALLSAAAREWLAALPESCWLTDEVFACHGSPRSDLEPLLHTAAPPTIRPATLAEIAERTADIGAPVIVCGHTHLPAEHRRADGTLVVNPGSVGLQAYHDDHPAPYVVATGTPHARYAILERAADGAWSAEFRAVEYDWHSAAALAAANGRPDWAEALATGSLPPL